MPVQQVGRPVKRVEDPKLITGSDPYVNDMRLAGAATVAFVRSPHAHAVIRRIDAARARALPGVLAVLTGADVNPEIGVIHTPVLPEMFASFAWSWPFDGASICVCSAPTDFRPFMRGMLAGVPHVSIVRTPPEYIT